MACLTFQTDLTNGIVLPCRVSSFTGVSRKFKVTVSTGIGESMISPGVVRALNLVPVGETNLNLPYATVEHAPFYVVRIDLLFGLLGRPLRMHTMHRVTLVESELARGRGIVLGTDILARGCLTFNSQTTTICT